MTLLVVVTFLAVKINTFLDKVWIANISKDVVTAVSTVGPIYSVVSALGIGLGTGACVCIGYYLGRKDFVGANRMASTCIHMALVVSIPTVIFLLFGTDMLFKDLEGDELRYMIHDYILPLAIGSPVIILAGVLANFLKVE